MPYSSDSTEMESSTTYGLAQRSTSSLPSYKRSSSRSRSYYYYNPHRRSASARRPESENGDFNGRSATAVDFARNKQPTYQMPIGLPLVGNHLFYSSYFRHQFRSRSTLSLLRQDGRKSRMSVKPNEPVEVDEDDEEDEKPSLGLLTLMRIGAVYFGIEIMFSMEIALAIPILLQLKVSEESYSLVYVLSPIIGFLLQPILGVLSDRCQSRFGRRRPFILILSLIAFFGNSLVLNAKWLGQRMGDKNSDTATVAIVLVGLGVTFLDFGADTADSPLRALLLDVCNSKDQETGLNIHSFLGGTGSALGFILSAINWNDTFLNFIGDELQILYIFSAVLFFTTLIITLTSVKEVPFVMPKDESLPLLMKNTGNQILELPDEIHSESIEKEELINEYESSDDEDDVEDQPITLKMLYHSVLKMPQELARLMICQLFAWLAFFSTTLFFTDFIGEGVYMGDPHAAPNSTQFINYQDGVKMGCWCLLSYSLVSAVFAGIMEKILAPRFSTRTLYFFSNLLYAICVALIFFVDKIYFILPLFATVGVILTSNVTLPYQMVAEFHEDKEFRSKSAVGTKRGLGVDCALLNCMYFASQALCASFMSVLTAALGPYTIVLVASLFAFCCCTCAALVVIYPDEKQEAIAPSENKQ